MFETRKKERALLVMVEVGPAKWPSDVLASEFRNLVSSCGLEVSDLLIVRRKEINPPLYIGQGKAQEIYALLEEDPADVVIFNNNLNPRQQQNIEDTLKVKTIDRTQLILDIFAAHANTQEGRLEVELAQLEYYLPRLRGKGVVMSRLGGGIGTRGPGEQKLEVDRRRVKERIARVKSELSKVRARREVMRKKRFRNKVRISSLVGYTNAGKTSLFNVLTQSEQKVSDALFTTLDAVTHIFPLRENVDILLSDTVGFIYDLPPHLVEAFKATLEELSYADTILHVIDVSSPDIKRIMSSVEAMLVELSLTEKSTLTVFNKIDRVDAAELERLRRLWPEAVFVSARTGQGLDLLRRAINRILFLDMAEAVLKLPFSRMDMVAYIHKNCEVIQKSYQADCTSYFLRAEPRHFEYFKNQGIDVKIVE